MEEIKIKNVRKFIKKDGDEKTYIYDQKKYNDSYYQKHKDDINKKIECELCKGRYCLMTKARHEKTKKHLNLINK